MAALLGMTPMTYFDLEAYDDELSAVPSLDQLGRLAAAHGVSSVALLTEDGQTLPTSRVTYPELVNCITAHLSATRKSVGEFEEQAGWSLSDFLTNQLQAYASYPVEFLKSPSSCLGVDWLEVLP